MAETTMQGHGRMLPVWLDTQHPTAVHGTARVRSVDREFLVGLDRRRMVFQLWGPSIYAGGWVALQDVTDDFGRPLPPNEIAWELLTAALIRGREEGLNAAERVRDHNARLQAQQEKAGADDRRERVGYFQKAVYRELDGDGRWNAQDVERGYRSRWV